MAPRSFLFYPFHLSWDSASCCACAPFPHRCCRLLHQQERPGRVQPRSCYVHLSPGRPVKSPFFFSCSSYSFYFSYDTSASRASIERVSTRRAGNVIFFASCSGPVSTSPPAPAGQPTRLFSCSQLSPAPRRSTDSGICLAVLGCTSCDGGGSGGNDGGGRGIGCGDGSDYS